MARVALTTKAGTLRALSGVLERGRVLPLVVVTAAECTGDGRAAAIRTIQEAFADELLIVRSSAQAEDALLTSNAGHFTTVPNVRRADPAEIGAALDQVLASYGEAPAADEQVLVQPMLRGITAAGVAFTADLDTLAPYYVVNYDESGSTDAITGGGSSARASTYVHFKRSPLPPPTPLLAALVAACRELEELCGHPHLDVEFAFRGDELFILQVRPIVTRGKDDLSSLDLGVALEKIHRKVEKLSAPHPNLLGDRVIFGVMPDWNPAEIIGIKPRLLALSLYKELVTDSIWAYQRDNYGYRNLRSHPLMVSLLGMPFIDVRVDFNSFIPKALDESIAARLADYYLQRLDESPGLHDKVEFEIVFSCYHLSLREELTRLEARGFSRTDIASIESTLRDLTNAVIDRDSGLLGQDLERVDLLAHKRVSILESNLSDIEKIYWLVEHCKRYGTLPFAGIARAAFIAVQLLRSCVTRGILTREEHDHFLRSLNTVTRRLATATRGMQSGAVSRAQFLAEFGHLRPGTYDILSPRYDESFDAYFAFSEESAEAHDAPPFALSAEQSRRIDALLEESGIRCDAAGLMRFLVTAIEGREQAKLVFTRTLSDTLRLVADLGARYGVSADELSHVDIRTILHLYASLDHLDLKEIFQRDAAHGARVNEYTRAIRLPSLICKPADVYGFFVAPETPTFVTMKRVVGEVLKLDERLDADPSGAIVFITSADPGFDFLFARKIAGLVTCFGGANSHMAIRCAEFGIPAVIGAGEINFSTWSRAAVLEMNCGNHQVQVVR